MASAAMARLTVSLTKLHAKASATRKLHTDIVDYGDAPNDDLLCHRFYELADIKRELIDIHGQYPKALRSDIAECERLYAEANAFDTGRASFGARHG